MKYEAPFIEIVIFEHKDLLLAASPNATVPENAFATGKNEHNPDDEEYDPPFG